VNPGEDFVRMFMTIIFFKQGEYSEKMVRRALIEYQGADIGERFNAYVKSMRGLLGHDMAPLYAQIKSPTMVLWGENDALVPVHHADVIAGGIPGARKVVLPECGHCPMIEKPEEFNRIVMEFIG
jgi:pimeloyl-ACP methyl ester carboxylesterase